MQQGWGVFGGMSQDGGDPLPPPQGQLLIPEPAGGTQSRRQQPDEVPADAAVRGPSPPGVLWSWGPGVQHRHSGSLLSPSCRMTHVT